MEEQKKEMLENLRIEKLEYERKKVNLDYEAKERLINEMEKQEKQRDKSPINDGFNRVSKILDKDEGAEKLSK